MYIVRVRRGVAAINKLRGQIRPCIVGNRSSACATGLITCVNMRALMNEVGGLCPLYNKSGGGGLTHCTMAPVTSCWVS